MKPSVVCRRCGTQQPGTDGPSRCVECGAFLPKPTLYGYSPFTDTWYSFSEYEEAGDGVRVTGQKTEVDRDDVPQEWLDATDERGEA